MSDKAFHLLVGAGLAEGSYSLWAAYGPKSVEPAFVSLAVSVLFATAKEGVDAMGFGSPDLVDGLFTVLGGLIGTVLSWALVRVMR